MMFLISLSLSSMVLLLLLLLRENMSTVQKVQAVMYKEIPEMSGYEWDNYYAAISTTESVEECALKCVISEGCLSFTYTTEECFMYDYFFSPTSERINIDGAKTYRKSLSLSDSECTGEFTLNVSLSICYKIEDGLTMTWEEAMNHCLSLGSTLFTIEYDWKREAYNKVMNGRANIWWAGGYDLSNNNEKWIWWDGEDIDGGIWKQSEPNWGSERCLALLSGRNLSAADSDCSFRHNYICEKRLGQSEPNFPTE